MDNLGVFMFELKISDDTYSTALSARAEDIIFKYVKDLEQAGSGEAWIEALPHGRRSDRDQGSRGPLG